LVIFDVDHRRSVEYLSNIYQTAEHTTEILHIEKYLLKYIYIYIFFFKEETIAKRGIERMSVSYKPLDYFTRM